MTTLIDLSKLPAPSAAPVLPYETILAELVAYYKSLDPAYTALLESDPAMKILEDAAYRELLLRQIMNDTYRQRLLSMATGGDLDQLAAFYGVERLTDETDAAFRTRVQQRIQGWSTAGGAAHYRFWALSADPEVADVQVDSPAAGAVRISVLSSQGDGTPSQDLIDAVTEVITRDDVKVLTDTVTVVAAQGIPVNVTARVWLRPETALTEFNSIRDGFPAKLRAAAGLGQDVTLSWLVAAFMGPGVYKVTIDSPSVDVVVTPNQFAYLNNYSVTNAGRNE